jgi:hypothetical protein
VSSDLLLQDRDLIVRYSQTPIHNLKIVPR